MTKRDINLTKIMIDTLGVPVFYTHLQGNAYYDCTGNRLPKSWLPDGDLIIIRHRSRESLENWMNQFQNKEINT